MSDSWFESLRVSIDKAREILAGNSVEQTRLDRIESQQNVETDGDTKTTTNIVGQDGFAAKPILLWRMGPYVGLAQNRQPLISHTRQIGKFAIAALHRIESPVGVLHRFQGVALPTDLLVNSYTWQQLVKAAARPNKHQAPACELPRSEAEPSKEEASLKQIQAHQQ